MTRQPTHPRVRPFAEAIDACFVRAGCLPALASRHSAVFDDVPPLKERIERELADDPAAAAEGMAWLLDRFEAFKQRHAVARLPYSPLLDGRYPYRDELMNPICIAALGNPPQPLGACADPLVAAILPYVDPDAGEQARAAAYRDKLVCRTITERDLPSPHEQPLIGQRGVFAARRIRAGECLGVYGGRLMTPALFFTCVDDSFVLSAASDGELAFVDGENILAMANTLLAYDGQGVPVAQAADGYNMKTIRFQAVSSTGRRFSIGAFFALHDVDEGTELRWNYSYSPEAIARVFGPLYHAARQRAAAA